MAASTITTSRTHDQPCERVRIGPYLVLAFDCRCPLRGGRRISLEGVIEAEIGRGACDAVARTSHTAVRIDIEDARMSSRHFQLRRSSAGWVAKDTASKNGTFVNGRALVEPAALENGDILEAGASLFVFRDEVEVELGAGERGARPGGALPALSTMALALETSFAQLARISRSTRSILICGETGTGKELTARAVHALSERPGPFVAVNCGALAPTLIESELFGARKGAYSGATEERQGWVRAAHRGTLFLDEIAELSEPSQVALLRVLQEGQVVPVGSTTTIPVDVRFVAATHQDLPARIRDGRFREDLYARLTGFRITLPPLRERAEDIGLIVAAVLRDALATQAEQVRFRGSAGRALFRYDWPRNIRELDNAVRAALVLADTGEIALAHLPPELREALDRGDDAAALERGDPKALREMLIELYRRYDGNVTAVARHLGKARAQVQRWNRRFELDPRKFRRG